MKKMGDNRRVQKVEKEIQAVVGMYLISGFSEPLDVFVTLSRSVMSADLKSVKIYFTVLPKGSSEITVVDEKVIAQTEKILNENTFAFQNRIAKELKLRFTPKIKFFHDESVDKVRRVDQILSEISSQNKPDND